MSIRDTSLMWTKNSWNKLAALGYLMLSAALVFRHDIFPQSTRYGYWFCISIAGFVVYVTGKLIYRHMRN